MSSVKTANMFDGTQRQRKQKEVQNDAKLNPSLTPPYVQKWPEIQKQHQKMILEEIKTVFGSKVADQWISEKTKKLKKRYPEESSQKIEEILVSIFSREGRYAGKDVKQLVSSASELPKLSKQELKEFLTIGVHDITRCIERNKEFYLVVCCGCSSSDKWICQNLLCQSLLNNVPVCSINGLAEVVTQFIAQKHVTAIAFNKVENNPLKELAEFVIDKIPAVSTPWVKLWGQNSHREKMSILSNNKVEDRDKKISLNTMGNEAENIITCNGDIKTSHKRKTRVSDIEYLEPIFLWKEKKNKKVSKSVKQDGKKIT